MYWISNLNRKMENESLFKWRLREMLSDEEFFRDENLSKKIGIHIRSFSRRYGVSESRSLEIYDELVGCETKRFGDIFSRRVSSDNLGFWIWGEDESFKIQDYQGRTG